MIEQDEHDTSNWFVVSWCREGFEGVIPVSDLERKDTFDILSNKPPQYKAAQSVNMMILRARVNSQRFYEVYAVQAECGITAEDIEGMFKADPQCAADTIRKLGKVLYSDRNKGAKKPVIT